MHNDAQINNFLNEHSRLRRLHLHNNQLIWGGEGAWVSGLEHPPFDKNRQERNKQREVTEKSFSSCFWWVGGSYFVVVCPGKSDCPSPRIQAVYGL